MNTEDHTDRLSQLEIENRALCSRIRQLESDLAGAIMHCRYKDEEIERLKAQLSNDRLEQPAQPDAFGGRVYREGISLAGMTTRDLMGIASAFPFPR